LARKKVWPWPRINERRAVAQPCVNGDQLMILDMLNLQPTVCVFCDNSATYIYTYIYIYRSKLMLIDLIGQNR